MVSLGWCSSGVLTSMDGTAEGSSMVEPKASTMDDILAHFQKKFFTLFYLFAWKAWRQETVNMGDMRTAGPILQVLFGVLENGNTS